MTPADAPAWLWVACTVAAAGVQTARNILQRGLVASVGTVGATHVRFLFGLPFGLMFVGALALHHDLGALEPGRAWLAWTLLGAVGQIFGTALMLAAMRERSFVVAIACIKTEPVQLVLFALVFLGEGLGLQASLAVMLATVGVVLMSMPPNGPTVSSPDRLPRAAWLGIVSGSMFALSAVGFRGAIVELGADSFVLGASATLAMSLLMQTVLLSAWLLWRDRQALAGILRLWRPSLLAGAIGALGSQLWFLAFALQSAAAVRTVGLVEILFAQIVSQRLLSQSTTRREAAGMLLMITGVVWLLMASP